MKDTALSRTGFAHTSRSCYVDTPTKASRDGSCRCKAIYQSITEKASSAVVDWRESFWRAGILVKRFAVA